MDLILLLLSILIHREEVSQVPKMPPESVKQQVTPVHVAAKPKPAPTVVKAAPKRDELVELMLHYQPKLTRTKAQSYVKTVRSVSKEYHMDPLWIVAMMWQESRFLNQSESGAGAVGLMQILPSTARGMGVNPKKLWVPEVNIRVGVKYLAADRKRFKGSLRLATLAYNQGSGRVAKGTYRTWYYNGVNKHYTKMKSYLNRKDRSQWAKKAI